MFFKHGIHRIHGRVVSLVLLFGVAVSAVAAEPGITVEARQRYPWNGLVDLKFTITGESGTKYDTSFVAKDMVGGTNIAMKTIRKSNGVAANVAKEQLQPGTYNWVWDAAADLPKDFMCERVTVTGTADLSAFPYTVKFNANGGTGMMANESFIYGTAQALTANAFTRTGYTFQGWATSASGSKVYNDKQSVSNLTETSGAVVNLYAVWKAPLYMVINLSSGSSSSSYPISYLDAVPDGGWANIHKTSRLILRRCEAGSFKMGGTSGNPSGSYNVTLTQPFYCGIFEVTRKQYTLVMGSNPSANTDDLHPVERVTYNTIRGTSNGSKWPSSSSVDSTSFLGRLRNRTGLSFDLPTEAQWEYACRAGTTTAYNNGRTPSTSDEAHTIMGWVGVCCNHAGGSIGTQRVGEYRPNAWGLYDMHGNVWEWCLDWYGSLSNGVTNPKGPSSGSKRVIRGGSTYTYPSSCASYARSSQEPSKYNTNDNGFRICLTLSN